MKVQARRTNVRTKTVIALVDGKEDDGLRWALGGLRWATICVDHGWLTAHRTHALAVAWMAEPWMWCRDCQTISVGFGTTEHRPKGRGEMNEAIPIRRVPNEPVRTPDTIQDDMALADHFEGDGCDLSDPHEAAHHFADPRGTGYCSHPECRADDLNDDAKVGL